MRSSYFHSLLLALLLCVEAGADTTPQWLAPGNFIDVLPTREYIEFSNLDPQVNEFIEWDPQSGATLYIPKEESPFLILRGRALPGVEISVNEKWIATSNGTFAVKIPVPLEPSVLTIKVYRADSRHFGMHRWVYYWLKLPPSLRFKVREDDEEPAVEKVAGYFAHFKKLAFTQLLSKGDPVTVVDLDTTAQAGLSFRIYSPPDPEERYDSWQILLRDSRGQIAGQLARAGNPPRRIRWSRIAEGLQPRETYTYQVVLTSHGTRFVGPLNAFRTIAGYTLLEHRYLPSLQLDTREELGLFSFRDTARDFVHSYFGADVKAVMGRTTFLQAGGLASLQFGSPESALTFYRVGMGLRFYGLSEGESYNSPLLSRVDVSLNFTDYGLYAGAPAVGRKQISVMTEAHLLPWEDLYLQPTLEYAARPDFAHHRLSMGLSYIWWIRDWSVKLGVGAWYEQFWFPGQPGLTFRLLRAGASVSFTI